MTPASASSPRAQAPRNSQSTAGTNHPPWTPQQGTKRQQHVPPKTPETKEKTSAPPVNPNTASNDQPASCNKAGRSSATWSSSSGDMGLVSDTNEVEDRSNYVQEYNRLAKKHGIRVFVPEDYDSFGIHRPLHTVPETERKGWFSRMILRHTPPIQAQPTRLRGKSRPTAAKHKRSVSDLTLHLRRSRTDNLKDEDIQGLVRLCGKSFLYLPSEFAPCSLILPTCFRATAQFLIQHVTEARGVFRIPGSVRTVNALYDYYCAPDQDGSRVAGTARCPNLPSHIDAGIHDVASTFKRLLNNLPGGVLGSLSLFDAFIAVHSQLRGDPEFMRTRKSKLRARLIALAIGSLRSQFRRELICAVFGLLSLIGREAEMAPRENEDGRPLPTSDLMGYNALGIIFGPLLVSNLLSSYTLKLADPCAGLVLFPMTPPKPNKEHRRSRGPEENRPTNALTVDKIHVANNIAEMLITHWREVVKHMKALHVLKSNSTASVKTRSMLRLSLSENMVIPRRSVLEKNHISGDDGNAKLGGPHSPTTPSPQKTGVLEKASQAHNHATIDVKWQRPSGPRAYVQQGPSTRPSRPAPSSTVEESAAKRSSSKLHRPLQEPTRMHGSRSMEVSSPAKSEDGPGRSLTGTLTPQLASLSIGVDAEGETPRVEGPRVPARAIGERSSKTETAARMPKHIKSAEANILLSSQDSNDHHIFGKQGPVSQPPRVFIEERSIKTRLTPGQGTVQNARPTGSRSMGEDDSQPAQSPDALSDSSNTKMHRYNGSVQQGNERAGALGIPYKTPLTSPALSPQRKRNENDVLVLNMTSIAQETVAFEGRHLDVPAHLITDHDILKRDQLTPEKPQSVDKMVDEERKTVLTTPEKPRAVDFLNAKEIKVNIIGTESDGDKKSCGDTQVLVAPGCLHAQGRIFSMHAEPTRPESPRGSVLSLGHKRAQISSQPRGPLQDNPSLPYYQEDRHDSQQHSLDKDTTSLRTPSNQSDVASVVQKRLLGVKAMAAMFDSAAKERHPMTTSPRSTSRARPEARASSMLSEYTRNPSPTPSAKSSLSFQSRRVQTQPGRSSLPDEAIPKRGRALQRSTDESSTSPRSMSRRGYRSSGEHIPARPEIAPQSTPKPERIPQTPHRPPPASFDNPEEDLAATAHPPSRHHAPTSPTTPHNNQSHPPTSPEPQPADTTTTTPPAAAAAAAAASNPPPTALPPSDLHDHLRALHDQLAARADECAHLRRELGARTREAQAWRARAEAAERTARAFGDFARRVRRLRDAGGGAAMTRDGSSGALSVRTEDGAVLAARIRGALGGLDGAGSEGGLEGEGEGEGEDEDGGGIWGVAEEMVRYQRLVDDEERASRPVR